MYHVSCRFLVGVRQVRPVVVPISGRPRSRNVPGRFVPSQVRGMWKGSGRSVFQALLLEKFKFSLFIITPIATAAVFHSDAAVEAIVRTLQYVSYPAEDSRPIPTTEQELAAARAEIMARRQANMQGSDRPARRGGTYSALDDK